MKNQHSAGAAIAALFLLGSAPAAQAQALVWSGWERVEILEPTVKGWVWITLKDGATVTCGSTSGQTTTKPYLFFSSDGSGIGVPIAQDGGFDRTYSTLLTAMMTDRDVMFRLLPSTDGQYCFVERIRIR